MNRQIIISILLVASLLAVLPGSVSADQWVSPGDDVQAAVNAVMAAGGTVYFAPGTYHVNVVIDTPASSLTLHGAGQGVCVLDGDENGSVIVVVNTGASAVTIEGFTLTDGSGDTVNWGSDYPSGGGIYSNYANLTVRDCTFTQNEADYGGGMYNENYEEYETYSNSDYPSYAVLVQNCLFEDNYAGADGGGLNNYYSDSVTVTNCVFRDNHSYYSGGGMENDYTGTVVVTGCLFTGNYSENDNGGGMLNCDADTEVTDCIFEYNISSEHGGGMMNGNESAPVVTNCIFRYNEAHDDGGGGMMNAGGAAPQVISCTFTHNWADNRGGGMYNAGSTGAEPFVSDCIFSYNEAGWRGGGMDNHGYSVPTVTNCVFVGNRVIGESLDEAGADGAPAPLVSAGGGGMFIGYSTELVMSNCTFTQNYVPYYSSGGSFDGENGGGVKFNSDYTCTATNCIIWGNYPNDVLDVEDGDVVIEYSDIGGGYSGTGNIDANPMFVSPDNLSLRSASPCIDAGTDTSAEEYGYVLDDILGVERPQHAAYDMGAYEFTHYSDWSPALTQPLARTQLATTLALWEDLSDRLPDAPSEEMAALIAQIQEHMANAAQLTNPIYASGQLTKAAGAMQQLAALLA